MFARQQLRDVRDVAFKCRLLRVLIVGQSQRQQVVRLDVQLPQQIFLPRRHDFVVHRFHIGVGQQAQHPKVFDIAHHVGKLLDDMLVAEIPAQDDLRHLEMVLHDGDNFLGLFRRQLELVENHLHAFGARDERDCLHRDDATCRYRETAATAAATPDSPAHSAIQRSDAWRQLLDIANRDQ